MKPTAAMEDTITATIDITSATTVAPLGEATFGLTNTTLRPGLTKLLVSCQLVRKADVSRFPKFNSAGSVFAQFKSMADLDREHVVVLGLDRRNRCTSLHVASVGTMTEAMVSAREIFRVALLAAACSIVVLHNHPSGSPRLSAQDIAIGKRLAKVGEDIGITVIDFITVAAEGYESMNEKGMMF